MGERCSIHASSCQVRTSFVFGPFYANVSSLLAAHCFTNDPDGALLPLENYEIAVGKYFRDRNSNNDSNAQYSTVINFLFNFFYFLLINYLCFCCVD